MTRIIIEGPDGSGKTQLIDTIVLTLGLPLYPTQGPPKSPSEIIHRIVSALKLDNYIFDRFPLISQMVYGKILRDEHIFDPSWLNRLREDLIIYCRPATSTILSNHLKTKPHKDKEQVEKVNQKRTEIILEYDRLMERVFRINPHFWIYDYEWDTPEELCAELICVLAKKTLRS